MAIKVTYTPINTPGVAIPWDEAESWFDDLRPVVGMMTMPAPIMGKIRRELAIQTSQALPDVVYINGTEYRPV